MDFAIFFCFQSRRENGFFLIERRLILVHGKRLFKLILIISTTFSAGGQGEARLFPLTQRS